MNQINQIPEVGQGRMLSGVMVTDPSTHRDVLGSGTEIFREDWLVGRSPVQWNWVMSGANVLRGVHVHHQHTDHLLLYAGRMVLALVDLRDDSPTVGMPQMMDLTPDPLQMVCIPPGVAHGFYFLEPSTSIVGVSHYWAVDDELGCRWDDPALSLTWKVETPILSSRDREAGSFAAMRDEYRAACGRKSLAGFR
ncbi:MAG: dTDP-4-dehydrorhamnose 3,5-epimerase family protein [Kaiparowitsia implicata GSE-PSE-MK54-09C]|jgi:dTDP-4-dehydrorhamnose 3,5-epimerase|nr:dTDP-4-dehydrorhamnose 3,5-epimerase family protein [Kaiparowitsia implicata GSE-PSE-MK54-09C]